MADTVEPVHTSKHQQTDKQSGYAGIDTPNPFGGDTDTGMNLVMCRAACLGGEHLQATDSEDGKHCNGEHDDSQAANPLCHTAPEQYSMRKSSKMVAPVLLKPDMVSKNALAMSGMYLPI